MKVILKEDLSNLGAAGDVVEVKPGYARNYLIPQGLAYLASAANVRRLEEEQKQREERSRRDYLEARRRASQLQGKELVFRARAGEEGKLFGSVTNADLADRLNEQGLDFEVDRRWIHLEEPLKALGDFTVPVRLHADVTVAVEVRVGVGVQLTDVRLSDREHASSAAGRVVDRLHDVTAAQILLRRQEEVHHQLDDLTRREVVARLLVRLLRADADQLLEDVAHLDVVHALR